jgi:hypothetical protein
MIGDSWCNDNHGDNNGTASRTANKKKIADKDNQQPTTKHPGNAELLSYKHQDTWR